MLSLPPSDDICPILLPRRSVSDAILADITQVDRERVRSAMAENKGPRMLDEELGADECGVIQCMKKRSQPHLPLQQLPIHQPFQARPWKSPSRE